MMNFADLVLCLLTGFVVPLAFASLVADGALLAGGRWAGGPHCLSVVVGTDLRPGASCNPARR
mgnify:CR=1 FL=1